MALILDSGALYAALDQSDEYHLACRDLILSSGEELVIPIPVLTEVDYFISTRLHPGIRLTLLSDVISSSFRIEQLVDEDFVRIHELCERYADSDIGFVDAAVLAIVERLNEPKLATLDRRHFGLLRPRHIPSLILLP